MRSRRKCVPEFFAEVDGVVHAELWQRPADICLMFFPCRAVMSVGSFTRLECPRPSWTSHRDETGYLMFAWSKLQDVECTYLEETQTDADYLSLTVAAPGVDVSGGGQSQHMFAAHSYVFDEQPLQRRNHLRVGFILQHGVWQADQTLWRINRMTHTLSHGSK